MKIKRFKTLKEAMSSILDLDIELRILSHQLAKGRKIKNHYHLSASEWVVFDEGKADFFYENNRLEIKPEKEQVIVIFLPPKTTHGLIARSPLNYLVIRDKEVKTIYVE